MTLKVERRIILAKEFFFLHRARILLFGAKGSQGITWWWYSISLLYTLVYPKWVSKYDLKYGLGVNDDGGGCNDRAFFSPTRKTDSKERRANLGSVSSAAAPQRESTIALFGFLESLQEYWHVLFLCLARILLTRNDSYRVHCCIPVKRKLTRISALTSRGGDDHLRLLFLSYWISAKESKEILERKKTTTYSLRSKVKKWKKPSSLSELDVFHYVLSTHQWRKWKLKQTNQELNWPRVFVHIFSLRKDKLEHRHCRRSRKKYPFLIFPRISFQSSNSFIRRCRLATFLIGRQLYPICALLVIISIYFSKEPLQKRELVLFIADVSILFFSARFSTSSFASSSMSDEYWIISVPGKSAPRQRYDEVCQATGRDQLSQNYQFNIPDLKVRGNVRSAARISSLRVIVGWNTRFTGCIIGWSRSNWWLHRRVT